MSAARLWVLCPILVGLIGSRVEAAPVDSAKLAHCATIAAADERLACYDQLASRRSAVPATAPAPAQTPAPGSLSARSPTPATVAAQAASPPSAFEAGSKPFGLTAHKVVGAETPTSIRAAVTAVSQNAVGDVSLRLDNGQTWSLTEPGASLKAGDLVTIKRASLGSFLIVTPDRRSYRARRLQ